MTRFDQNKSSSGWTLFLELNIRENINSRTYTRLGYHTTSTLIYSVRKWDFSQRTSREAVRKSGDREERGVYFFPWHATRKAMRQLVDLLKLSLKTEFDIYRKFLFLFQTFSLMWNYLSFFVRNISFFWRYMWCKESNEFLGKENTIGKHYNMAGLQLFRQTVFPKA